MAGQPTDSWTRRFTVSLTSTPGTHTVVVTERGDGVNDPEISATVDGQPVEVAVASEVLVDGITPAWIDCPNCRYRAIDEEDLTDHHALNHPRPRQEEASR
jgi:hypothetical protein